MKLLVKKGKTSKRVFIFIQDSSSTTGAGLTGLTSGSSGLVCYRCREDDGNAAATQLVLSGGTKGTWSSGGFVEKDSTNAPGVYELGLDNAGLATGSDQVIYMLKGATNMAPVLLEVQLVDFDPQDAVHLGLSALPNTACTGNASLLTSGTSTDQLSVSSGRVDIGKTLGTAVTLDSNSVLNVSAKYLAGTSLTGRDIGSSVLLSSGTGTGQLSISAGIASVNTTQWAGQATLLDANNLPKVDIEDIRGVVATLDANSVLNVSAKYLGGTLLTGRDIGSSVLLSSGTGTGQLDITTGVVKANATQWAGQATLLDANNLPKVDIEDIRGTLSVGVAGYIGPDWSHVNAPTTSVSLSGTTIGTLTTYTGNTVQTGDSFALLGSPANTTIAGDLAELATELDTIITSYPPTIRKNVALANFEFILYSSADHVTPITGRTVTAQRSIDGAALASCTNSVTELSNGIYKINLSAADLNGNVITLRFSATGADDCMITIVTQS